MRQPDNSTEMHPRITELLQYITDRTASLRAAYDAVPPERRGLRSAPGRWSPAEVVHHVAIVERRVTQRLQALVEQARTLEPERQTSSVLATIDTRRAEERTRRFVTSEATEPHDSDPRTVWAEFEETRRALERVIATADGVDLAAVSAPHPALGPLNGYDWIAFAGSHAARHAHQIREDAVAR